MLLLKGCHIDMPLWQQKTSEQLAWPMHHGAALIKCLQMLLVFPGRHLLPCRIILKVH